MVRNRHIAAVLVAAALIAGQARPADDPPVKPVATLKGHAAEVIALAFTPDGKGVVAVSPKDIRAWDIASGKAVASAETPGGTVAAVAPDGKTAAFTTTPRVGRPVVVRSAADGKEVFSFGAHADVTERTAFGSLVGALAYSPDGKRLATAGRSGLVGGRHGLPGGVVKVWDAATGKQLVHVPGPRPGVSASSFTGAVAFSADGKFLAAGTDGAGGELPESGEVIVWDAADGKAVRSIRVRDGVRPGDFHSAVTAVALSPDGKLVAASFGNRPARSDGLLLADAPTASLQVWEVATGKIVHTLRGHATAVGRLAFSPDGKRLASAGEDRTVRVWDAATGKQLRSIPFEAGPARALAFSPDGKHLAAGGSHDGVGVVAVWSTPE